MRVKNNDYVPGTLIVRKRPTSGIAPTDAWHSNPGSNDTERIFIDVSYIEVLYAPSLIVSVKATTSIPELRRASTYALVLWHKIGLVWVGLGFSDAEFSTRWDIVCSPPA
jgi:hypothetical protein